MPTLLCQEKKSATKPIWGGRENRSSNGRDIGEKTIRGGFGESSGMGRKRFPMVRLLKEGRSALGTSLTRQVVVVAR